MEGLTIVPAGAGSGKTYRIKTDLTNWVRQKKVAPDRILAVTFTEAAAAELRGRIRSSLLAEGMIEEALAVEQAYVSTIHGLGLRILSEHAFATEGSPRPRALAEAERDLLIRQALAHAPALNDVKADLPRFGYRPGFGSDTTMEDSFRTGVMSTLDLLRGLGDVGEDPKLIEPAIERIRHLYGPVTSDPKRLEDDLCSAAAHLLEAFPDDLSAIATSKSAKEDFQKNHQALKRALRPDVLSRDWGLWNSLSQLRLSKRGAPTPQGYDDLAVRVVDAASQLSRHPGPLEDTCAHLKALVHGAQEIMTKHAELKRELGVIDYSDMICDAERLLRTQPHILEALLAEIDCVIIDEFQDTNPVQFALLWRIAQSAKRVLIVGDTKQSIMGFQGADPRLSEALQQQHPEATDPLTGNWRSDPRLMDLINAISKKLFKDSYVPLDAQRPSTGQTFAEVWRIPEGRRSRKSRPEDHVAAHIADLLAQRGLVAERGSDPKSPAFRAVEPRDLAVLCPIHAMAGRYADALRKEGIPVRINEPGWLDSPVVMATCNALGFAADPSDHHAALVYLTLGPAAMSIEQALGHLADKELEDHIELSALKTLSKSSDTLPLETLFSRVLEAGDILEWVAGQSDADQAHADLMRLQAEAAAFTAAHRDFKSAAGFHGSTVQVFLGWLEARRAERDFDRHPDPGQSNSQGVEVVTWHACKGREWPITIVAGLDDGIGERPGTLRAEFSDFTELSTVLDRARLIWTPSLPVKEKQDRFVDDRQADAEGDARRLLYVALTRARDRLILEWPDFTLKKVGQSEAFGNYAEMLALECGLEIEPNGIKVGGHQFSLPTRICDTEAPEQSGRCEAITPPAHLRFGKKRPGFETTHTPWRVRPSSIAVEHPTVIDTKRTHLEGPPIELLIPGSATERGNILHKAMQVLMMRPDLSHRLRDALSIDQNALEALSERASELRNWLTAEGFTQIQCEVPVQTCAPSGAQCNGVIDLLAEGSGKRLILDHKSGSGLFSEYLAQLDAYRVMTRGVAGDLETVLAIHWIDEGVVEISSAGSW